MSIYIYIYIYTHVCAYINLVEISFDSCFKSWTIINVCGLYKKEFDVFILFINLQSHLYAFCSKHENMLDVSGINLHAASIGKSRPRKPLQLVVGTLTPSSVFLSWGFLINPHHDWTLPSHCPNDR
jgi:hypothetical protein